MLYRSSKSALSMTAYKAIVAHNPFVATIYSSPFALFASGDNVFRNTFTHIAEGIRVIETVFDIDATGADLERSVKRLGGFPIIIKAAGGSHGTGVGRVDSIDSLRSVLGLLKNTGRKCLLRQYIPHSESARLIVLGDKVIGSVSYKKPQNDFRTNTEGGIKVEEKIFSKEIQTMAVKSVNSLGAEFGGVDIIIDQNNIPYLAEVNTPCYFPRVQNATGIDIAGMIVDHLADKDYKKSK